jgi:hypothetical protein
MNRLVTVAAFAVLALLAAARPAMAAPPCTRAAAKAEILGNTHLKPVWPTLKAGGGVDRVYCRDLTRDGKPDMTATIYSGGTAGDIAWFVFRRVGAKWRLSLGHLKAYKVSVGFKSGDVIETQPLYRKDDPNCCPTGGFDHRRFHWKQGQFVLARRWHDAHARV